MALIEIRGLTTIFGPRPKVALERVRAGATKAALLAEMDHMLALRDVDLDVLKGEIFVVMGLSGSGKSTLVRHINRLIEPTTGTITIDGADVLRLSPGGLVALRRRKVSMVFQRFGLLPHRTVIENVAYALELNGVPRQERTARAAEWIGRVGLAGYETHYPAELSGGMQQRVGLARALCADTDIVLMDEPFSALDPLIRGELQDQLVELQKGVGKTIVFITHDLDEALRLGDRIAILKDGVVSQVGPPAEILLRPADDYVRAFVRDVNRARALTVKALMRPPALRLTAETLDEALAAMLRAGAEIGYVIDGERFSGIVTQAGLERARAGTAPHLRLVSLAEAGPVVAEGAALESALPALLGSAYPLPVVDGDGRLTGVVAADDVGAALAPVAPLRAAGQ